MIISFEVPDDLTFCRYRTCSGCFEDGQFVVTDEPGERTGPPGKWHVHGGKLRGQCAADCKYPANGQTVCGKYLPTVFETAVEAPDLRQ